MPDGVSAGIHWQVAQATLLQNIVFYMYHPSPTNWQLGIVMEHGSGRFFGDLTSNGSMMGADSVPPWQIIDSMPPPVPAGPVIVLHTPEMPVIIKTANGYAVHFNSPIDRLS
jgi:hypothetical protein